MGKSLKIKTIYPMPWIIIFVQLEKFWSLDYRIGDADIKSFSHKSDELIPHWTCIGGKLMQLWPDIFSDNLTKIYNRAIQTGVYPHAMKLVQIIALYKKGQGMIPAIITQLTFSQSLTKYLKIFYVKDLFLS